MTATGNEAVKLSQLQTALAGAGGGGFSEIAADIHTNGTVTAEGWTIKNLKNNTIGVFGFATEKTLFLTAIQSKRHSTVNLKGAILEITKDGTGVYNYGNTGCGALSTNFLVTLDSNPFRYVVQAKDNMSNGLFMAGALMLSNDFA